MTNADYTHLTLLVDRSGSMGSVQADAQGGINELLTKQFGLPGKLTVTLVEFDTEIDSVVRMATEPVAYVLEPRGMTRLLDSAGIEIKRTGADLAALDEAERPGRVLFVVVTDGQENSSTEYRFEQVRALVEEHATVYRWVFQFIGADDAAWQGESMGMKTAKYRASGKGTRSAYKSIDDSMMAFRLMDAPMAAFSMPDDIPEDDE
jgi:hypothetical protein